MCLPLLAALAVVSTVAAVGSAVVSTVGAVNNAKNQREQLAGQAAVGQQNAQIALGNASVADAQAALAKKNIELAKQNAEAATAAATTNAASVKRLADTNANNLLALTELNANAKTAITDINVGLADSISNFNLQIADGQSQIVLAKGALAQSVAERNAKTATFNAGLEEDNAQASLEASKRDEQASRLNYARLKSTQRTSLAANGVVLDEGSALRIQTDTDYFSDVDAATIQANGYRTALGFRGKETNDLIDAQMARIGGDIEMLNATTEAASMRAQAAGAKMQSDRDVLNMKLSTSFEILQARSSATIEAANLRGEGEINSANILNQGRIEATDYEMQAAGFDQQVLNFEGQAADYRGQAGVFGTSADNALNARSGISPFFSGLGAALDGASSVASKWYGYSKAGAFG